MNPMFEAVQSDADSSFRCLHFSCRHFSDNHTWHYHPEYELAYVIGSEGTRFVGDSIQSYWPGDLVLLGPNLPHCWNDEPSAAEIAEGPNALTDSPKRPAPPAADGHPIAGSPLRRVRSPELIVIQFRETSFGDGFLTLAETKPIKQLMASADTGLHFQGRSAELASELMNAAVEQSGLDRLLRTIETLHVLSRCKSVSRLATRDYCSNGNVNLVKQERIEVIRRYVLENLAGDISQAQIAQAQNLSPSAFSRFFKSMTGKTFVAFVNTLRINEACRRLHNPVQPITEIAMACGYNNMSNFNRQFLASQGMNPSEYRQRARRKVEHHSHYIAVHACE